MLKLDIRKASSTDLDHVVEIRDALLLQPDQAPHTGGGFFLPMERDRMARHLEEDDLIVAEDVSNGNLIGYALVLRHETFVAEMWERRPPGVLPENLPETARLGWYDQLGVRIGHNSRMYAPVIALKALEYAFQDHDMMGAGVMKKPAYNANAVKMMSLVGYQPVAQISETHEKFGDYTTEIHIVDKPTFKAAIEEPKVKRLILKATGQSGRRESIPSQ